MKQRFRFAWIGASLVLLLAPAGAQSVRHSFESDSAITCDACAGWNAAIEPFKIFGNTYYVGTAGLSSVLVTSDRGHILLDGALPQSAALIDRNIRRLGFRTEDIKLIVSSHAHFDHAGGIHALQRASGATVAASAAGANALTRGDNPPDDPQYAPGQGTRFPRVRRVRIVTDAETLRI
ncbi:MAG TPA: MBL fold metallo-hydrolase, partial [Vicinamibacterales bacterium]